MAIVCLSCHHNPQVFFVTEQQSGGPDLATGFVCTRISPFSVETQRPGSRKGTCCDLAL